MDQDTHTGETTMSIGDHIEDLRKRIIWSILPPLPLAVLFFMLADPIVRWFLVPLYTVLEKHGLPAHVQVLSPPEFLLVEMKIAIGAAILVAGPWILYQLWKFVSPGLHKHERRFVYFLIPGSAILCVTGLSLMYYIMLPLILDFMVTLAGGVSVQTELITLGDSISPLTIPILEEVPGAAAVGDAWVKMPEGVFEIAIPATEQGMLETLQLPMNQGSLISQQFQLSSYLGFVLLLMFAIGIAFQLPMVMLLLGWLGIVTPDWLRKNRKYALLILGIVSAMITPQDAVSMLMMLIPLYLLYEFGIALIVWVPVSRVAGKIDDA
ncbi:MAG TPA: twin-arginine translocase subunit TatC [Phycisphaerales bacterium]|nr:twin-arginine translocase subunit TatC [Phycisphaerales bacterium]